MYQQYFGFRSAPFSIAPDPHYLYLSNQHREALAHLLYGVGDGGGFVLLSGEVGTGKTTVCRCLLQQLPERTEVAFIINPRQTAIELLASVCDELGIACEPDRDSIKYYVDRLTAHLLDSHARGVRTVLLIDEAQNLATDVLEQIRLLTNLETDDTKLLQLVLLGQPELNVMLAQPELRQLAQRITARFHLGALSLRDARGYIQHRVAVAGVLSEIFPDWSIQKIHAASGGVPRLINVLCDRILLGVYGEQETQVRRRHVRKAITEVLSAGPGPAPRFAWQRPLTASLLTALVIVGAIAIGLHIDDAGSTNPSTPAPVAVVAKPEPWKPAPFGLRPGLLDLAARHGLDANTVTGDCAALATTRYRCHAGSTDLKGLLELHQPVLLKMRNPDDSAGDGYVTWLGGASGSVLIKDTKRESKVSATELSGIWSGEYLMLWTFPAEDVPKDLVPGYRGALSAWLNQRFDELEATPYSGLQVEVELYRSIPPPGATGTVASPAVLLADLPITRVLDRRAEFSPALLARVAEFRKRAGLDSSALIDAPLILKLESMLDESTRSASAKDPRGNG